LCDQSKEGTFHIVRSSMDWNHYYAKEEDAARTRIWGQERSEYGKKQPQQGLSTQNHQGTTKHSYCTDKSRKQQPNSQSSSSNRSDSTMQQGPY
jgi:hypothetical protein